MAPRPKRAELPGSPADRSRLLDAVSDSFQEKEQQRRRAISYSSEVKQG